MSLIALILLLGGQYSLAFNDPGTNSGGGTDSVTPPTVATVTVSTRGSRGESLGTFNEKRPTLIGTEHLCCKSFIDYPFVLQAHFSSWKVALAQEGRKSHSKPPARIVLAPRNERRIHA